MFLKKLAVKYFGILSILAIYNLWFN